MRLCFIRRDSCEVKRFMTVHVICTFSVKYLCINTYLNDQIAREISIWCRRTMSAYYWHIADWTQLIKLMIDLLISLTYSLGLFKCRWCASVILIQCDQNILAGLRNQQSAKIIMIIIMMMIMIIIILTLCNALAESHEAYIYRITLLYLKNGRSALECFC